MAALSPTTTRRLLVLGALLVGLTLVFQLLVPRIVASQLAGTLADALGRQVTIGGLSIGWLRGRVSARDFAVGGPLAAPPIDARRAPLRFARLDLNLAWWSLLAGELHISELALEGPTLFFERDSSGELAPFTLAQPQPPSGSEAQTGEDEPGWPIRLEAVSVRDLALQVERELAAERREVDLTLAELTLSDLMLRDGAITVGALAFQDPGLSVHRTIAAAGPEPAPQPEVQLETAPAVEVPAPPAAGDVAARPPSAPDSGATPVYPLLDRHRLESLDIRDARFTLLWEGGEPLDATLDFSSRGLSARRNEPFPLQFALELEGGSLALEGELGLRPLVFDGSLRWQDLPLPRLLEASGLGAEITLASGSSQGELRIQLSSSAESAAPEALQISGAAQVTELEGALPGLKLAFSQLSIDAQSLRVPLAVGASPEISLTQVTLLAPRLEYERTTAEAASAAEAPDAASDAQAASASAPSDAVEPAPRVSVDALRVEDGSLLFRERLPERSFETRWTKLLLEARGLRWPERDVESLKLTGRGSGGARLALDASLEGGRGRIETRLERVALAPLGAYAAQYTGMGIDSGRTSVHSLVEIDERSVRTETLVDLHQLRVHERETGWFQGVFGVPLDLALALLRDLEGDIHLPIRAELAEGQAGIGLASLLASTLRQAIQGAVTAPLKLLGSLKDSAQGALGSGLEPIAVVTGDATLEASQQERLTQLAETLDDKPGLQLVLHGRAGPADDAGIARRLLVQRAQAGEPLAGEDALGFLERRRVRRALAELDPEAPGLLEGENEALVEQLIAEQPIDDEQRRRLAEQRAERAREALVEDRGVPAAAIALGDPDLGEPGVVIELRAREQPQADAAG